MCGQAVPAPASLTRCMLGRQSQPSSGAAQALLAELGLQEGSHLQGSRPMGMHDLMKWATRMQVCPPTAHLAMSCLCDQDALHL